jgi:ESS family glutamate:Na+ symporter
VAGSRAHVPLPATVALGRAPVVKEPRLQAGRLFWLEQRPQERGRTTLMMRGEGEAVPRDLTPGCRNLRSRVHEYGGGTYAVAGNTVVFVDDGDRCLWRLDLPGQPRAGSVSSPQQLTVPGDQGDPRAFADGFIDPGRQRWLGVMEQGDRDHLVSVPLGGGEPTILHVPADFCGYAVASPSGSHLAWVEWRQPFMPWERSQLWLGRFDAAGHLSHARPIAGSSPRDPAGISVFQPLWVNRGDLVVANDRSGWWNLDILIGAEALKLDGDMESALPWRSLLPMQAEFAMPQWVYGMRTTAWDGQRLVAAACRDGRWELGRVSFEGALSSAEGADAGGVAGGATWQPLPVPFDDLAGLDADDGALVAVAASPRQGPGLLEVDLRQETFRHTPAAPCPLPAGAISQPEPVWFSGAGGKPTHAWYYPPLGGADSGSPLLVRGHSGPTAMASTGLSLVTQFWTSRGWGVVDVNYGGSTGFGRAYRERLDGQWGVVDVADCAAAALALVGQGKASKNGSPSRAAAPAVSPCWQPCASRMCSGPAPAATASATSVPSPPTPIGSRHAISIPWWGPGRRQDDLRGAITTPPRRSHPLPGDLLPGPRRQRGATCPDRKHGAGALQSGRSGGSASLSGRGTRLPRQPGADPGPGGHRSLLPPALSAVIPASLMELPGEMGWPILALLALALLLGLGIAIGGALGMKRWGLPEALLAGGLGLMVAPNGPLPLLPAPVIAIWNELPLPLLTLVFATLLLGKPLPRLGGLWRPLSAQLSLALTLAFGQYLVGGLTVLLVLQPWLGVSPVMACLIEVAYEGGHGSAAAMGPTYERLGLEGAQALGLAMATVGLLASTMVGGLVVVLGRARGWLSFGDAIPLQEAIEIVVEETPPLEAIPTDVPLEVGTVELPPLWLRAADWAVNLGLAGVAVVIGLALLEVLRWTADHVGGGVALVIDALPVFPLALVGSLLVRLALERSGQVQWVSTTIQNQTGTVSADLLITAATACLDLSLLSHDWLPLTVMAMVGLLWNLAVVLLLAPRILPPDWFERAILEFGQATGVAASGLLLLRMADPDDRSEAVTAFSIKQLLLQPVLAGGVITVVAPLVVTGWGLPAWTGLCFALVLLWSGLGLWLAARP